jgi:hypothetical protein
MAFEVFKVFKKAKASWQSRLQVLYGDTEKSFKISKLPKAFKIVDQFVLRRSHLSLSPFHIYCYLQSSQQGAKNQKRTEALRIDV